MLIGFFALFARSAAKPSVDSGCGARAGSSRDEAGARGRAEALRGGQVRREPREVPSGPHAQPQQPGGSQVRADGRERGQEPAGRTGAASRRSPGSPRRRAPRSPRAAPTKRSSRRRRPSPSIRPTPKPRPSSPRRTRRSPRPKSRPRPRPARKACGRRRSRGGGTPLRHRRPRPAPPRPRPSRARRPRPFRETPACGSSSTLRSTRATSWWP